MAKTELGSKHKCHNCGTKFFDLNKDPITCPKCGTVFEVASSAAPVASRAAKDEDEDNENENGTEVMSLEDADSTENGKVEAAETDEDVGEDDSSGGGDDDDTFLEEDEEDDGNVSDLIDGDIDNDEER